VARKKATRKKKAEPRSRGLTAREIALEKPGAQVRALVEAVEADGGSVLACYREPLAGAWQLFAALPIEKVEPTPFQRDISAAHVERLTKRIDEVGRFLDPIIAVRAKAGGWWTPNGNHRLHALRALGARAIVALLVPDEELAFRILALNTEKAHNLREKALEVVRMARELAGLGSGKERDHELVFEEPSLITLGCCYEMNGRFAGSAYQPMLKRTEGFLALDLGKALELRAKRAEKLIELDQAVAAAVAALKERGLESPYLKSFVIARIDPSRFMKGEIPEFDVLVARMLAAAKKFDAGKIKPDQVARSGGPPDSAE
jgi:ParB family chromosome partitioning protein